MSDKPFPGSDSNAQVELICARYLLPISPAETVLEDHAVVRDGSRIAAVMPIQEAVRQWPDAERLDLPTHALLPGFINAHTHTPMSLLRGVADDLELNVWLQEHIWPVEQALADPEFVEEGSRLAIAEMLRSGTTCFNDMYFFPDATIRACQQAGFRATIGIPVIEIETPWANSMDEYLSKGVALVEQFGDDPLVDFTFSPHAPYTVCDDTLNRVNVLSRELKLPINIHLLETDWDIRHSMQQYGEHPLARFERLGVLDSRLMAVHMTALTADDIQKIAERGIQVVHCPESNLKLAAGICPVRELVSAGVNVALGTDGAASNNDLDMLSEARTAALLAKGVSGDATAVSAWTALEMMTINGAKLLGKQNEIGSLEPGKQADLCAIDLNEPETRPLHNVASQLVYSASRHQVTDVWVAGRRLLRDRQLTSIDLDSVMSSADKWRQRIREVKSSKNEFPMESQA